MTGLNPEHDIILSISCIITTPDLHPLDPQGYDAIISTPQSILSTMNPWCTETHTASGLVTACLNSTITTATAASNLLAYVKHHVPKPKKGVLAGNSVHVDKLFLMKEPWSEIIEWLHYRILDVSAIKEGVRRWCGEEILGLVPAKKGVHVAREDVWESIEEARFYRRLLRGEVERSGEGGDGEEK